MVAIQVEGRSGWEGGIFKWKLCEVNSRTVFRGQNELIGEFKMAAADVISMKSTFIPTGIKRELVRSGMDCDRKGCRIYWRRTGGH